VLLEQEAYDRYREMPTLMRATVHGVLTALPLEYANWLSGNEGVPRVCLAVSSPEQIELFEDPPQHGWYETCPWTLFEYRPGPAALRRYDYTYFHHNLLHPDEAQEAIEFIRKYVIERGGTMLTDYDALEPRLDALLPVSELQNSEVSRVRLRDLVKRIKDETLSGREVRYERVPELLIEHFNTGESLRRFASDHLDLPLDQLIGRSAGVAEMVEALVDECQAQRRMEDLVCAMVIERPILSDQLAIQGGE
jgi:hypothetical protein